jgi:hypothetical protein
MLATVLFVIYSMLNVTGDLLQMQLTFLVIVRFTGLHLLSKCMVRYSHCFLVKIPLEYSMPIVRKDFVLINESTQVQYCSLT